MNQLEATAQETDEKRQQQNERYRLANRINESTTFIFSLIRRLSRTNEEDKAMVIVGMIVEEYLNARRGVEEYKEAGGDAYSIDRGLWKDVMGG